MRLPDQWPDLQGRVLLGFRIVWIITFLFALVSIAQTVRGDFLDRQLTENMSALGLASDGPRGSHAIRPVTPEQDHDIRDGDRLIAVDGRPVGSLRETVAATTGPDGAVTVLTLHNSGDPNPRSVRVIRDNNAIAETYAGSGLNFGDARNIGLAIRLILTSAWVLVALLLYLRRPHDLVAALISIGALLPMINFSYLSPAISPVTSDSIAFAGFGALILGLLLFPGGKIQPRWSLIGMPLIIAVWTIVLLARWLGLPVFPMQPLLVALCMLFILITLVTRFRSSESKVTRQQLKFVLLGVALAFTLFVPSMLWFQLERLEIVQASPWNDLVRDLILGIARLALPAGLLIALLRYRLFDADRLISRSVTYALMTLVIGIAFFAMERIIDFVGNQVIGGGIGAASFGIAAALAAVLLNPLHSRLVQWSEARFQKKLVALRDDLPELARDMRQISSMDELLDEILKRILPAVHAQSAVILDADAMAVLASYGTSEDDVAQWSEAFTPHAASNGFDINRTDPVFPLRMPFRSGVGDVVGWLLLGPRLDSSFYNRDERATLASLSDPLARAIATVAKREMREAIVNREMDGVKDRLQSLEEALKTLSERLSDSGAAHSD